MHYINGPRSIHFAPLRTICYMRVFRSKYQTRGSRGAALGFKWTALAQRVGDLASWKGNRMTSSHQPEGSLQKLRRGRFAQRTVGRSAGCCCVRIRAIRTRDGPHSRDSYCVVCPLIPPYMFRLKQTWWRRIPIYHCIPLNNSPLARQIPAYLEHWMKSISTREKGVWHAVILVFGATPRITNPDVRDK